MNGRVIRLVAAKNFGFIRTIAGHEYFFHRDDFTGHWDNLAEDFNESPVDIMVTFEMGEDKGKGPRAASVVRVGHPNEG